MNDRKRNLKTVRDCALTLLEYCDRTEQEMRRKLKEREYTPEDIEKTIVFLKEYHYIDDDRYSQKYIHTYADRKSIRRLRRELEQKGVSRERIDAALDEITVDESMQIAVWIQKKGYMPGEHLDPDQYRKLMAGLGRRGYSFDTIRRVMDGD